MRDAWPRQPTAYGRFSAEVRFKCAHCGFDQFQHGRDFRLGSTLNLACAKCKTRQWVKCD